MTVIMRVTERRHVRFLRVSRRLAASVAGASVSGQAQDRVVGLLAQGTASARLGWAALCCAWLFAGIPGKVGIAACGRVPDAPPWRCSPPASIKYQQ